MAFMGKADLSIWSPERAFTPSAAFMDGPCSGENGFPNISCVGIGLYQCLWSYDGWNLLNYITEELKSPGKNLPRAIIIAMSSIIVLYVLINMSYLTVLGADGLMASNAVASTMANRVFFGLDRAVSIMVASSIFGTCLVSCFTAARLPYVAAREGQFPQALSMIHIRNNTPVPAVLWNGTIATVLIFPNDFESLVNYFSFCMWIFHVATFATLLVLRRTKPVDKYPRLFKVPIIMPIVVGIIGIYLILVPFLKVTILHYVLYSIVYTKLYYYIFASN